jgi:hypothetical protein
VRAQFQRDHDDVPIHRRHARVQAILAEQVPYISLWHKTNAVVAQRSLPGIQMIPTADFIFLKDVARTTH